MKVIKPGVSVEWSAELTCTGEGNGGGGCGAVLLVEKGDLYRTSDTYDRPARSWSVTFCCCVCGIPTDVEGIPAGLAERIPFGGVTLGKLPVDPRSMQCAAHDQAEARAWPPPVGSESAEFGGGSVM